MPRAPNLTRGRPQLASRRRLAPETGGQYRPEQDPRNQQLGFDSQAAGPVPARDPMAREELAPSRPRKPDGVLEIRRRRRHGADRGRIERAAHQGQGESAQDAAAHLEAERVDVFVRHAVSEEMQDRPEDCRGDRRADECAAHGARGKVERDDQ